MHYFKLQKLFFFFGETKLQKLEFKQLIVDIAIDL